MLGAAQCLGLGTVGCATVQATNPDAAGIQRKQTMLESKASLEQGAVEAYATEVEKAQQQGKLNADPELTARVRRVSERLIPPGAADWHWGINALTTLEMNAHAIPSGRIMS